jgi:hypothetical protein
VLLTAGSACGRVHELDQGSYAIGFTQGDVFRDDCNLTAAGLGSLQTGFQTFGDFVQLAYLQQAGTSCLPVELSGQYQLSTQNFYADGTAANPVLPASGLVCRLDFVSVHLDAETVSSTSFAGVLKISYVASTPIACNCQLWVNYVATQCTSSACPLPSECP